VRAAAGRPVVLEGRRVRLRPPRPDDSRAFVRWADDPEFAWYQWGRGPGRFPDEAAVRAWWALFPERAGRIFVIEHDGRSIGFANYRDWSEKPRSCEIGIGIGERALWGQGLGRDALGALMRHLTEDLGAHRVTLSALGFNDRAVASYKACGFEVEGIGRDAVRADDGSYLDDVRMAWVAGRDRPAFDPRPVVLEGRHARLELLRMEHAEELYAALADEDTWRWVSDPLPRSADDMARYIRRALDLQIRGEHLPWLTRRLPGGMAVGTTRFGAIDRANRSVEIGWTMVGPRARRTAVNTEAKYLQLRHAFEDLGALRVWLKTDERNERSWRAIERIGATLEARIRNERVVKDGRVRDARYYSFIDREWPATKARLERLLAR